MSREYPDWISPQRAAEGNRVFSGTVPMARMKRLVPLLVDAQGEASFVARFSLDLDQRVIIDLQVEASLPLVCQASLEIYDEQVRRRSELIVITQDSDQKQLSDTSESVKMEHGRLAFAHLVEDELLLGLPHFPRKPGLPKIEYSSGGQIRKSADSQRETRLNPFAVLSDLLEQDKQD